MDNKYFNTLELHKVLALLEKECSNSYTKELAVNLTPMTDCDDIRSELDKTSAALELSSRFGTPSFYDVINMDISVDKAKNGGILSMAELLALNKTLKNSCELIKWREECEEETALDYLFDMLFDMSGLSRKITNAIISEEEMSDDASGELASIRRSINRQGIKIRENLEKMTKSASVQKYLQDNIVTIRDGRYVVPVKAEHKSNVSGLVHATSATGSTVFIEPMQVVEANNEIAILKGREQEEIQNILRDFSKQISENSGQIKSSFKAIVKLNLYFAKANLAAKMNACVPEIVTDGRILLKKARHPLIDKQRVVPVDFSLGFEYSTLVITGPNTGGKTVILKTIGLLTLMTMCGLLIPVSSGSVISVFDNILVDIGDNQSIENDLSTFSSHISNVNSIVEQADDKTLVLLDEIGSGTDPVEGAALAVSMVEKLRENNVKTVVTTHYQELKMYALDTPYVQNASCEFDTKTLSPTYRLIIGTPGKSNAFEISKRLGVSDEIIDYAKSLLNENSRRFEDVLERLEQARLEVENKAEQANILQKQAEEKLINLEKSEAELEKEKEEILSKARKEANSIITRTTRESDALIDELEKVRKQKEKTEFAENLSKAKSNVKISLNKLYKNANSDNIEQKPNPDIKKGDSVIIKDTNNRGTVLSSPDANGMCMVQAGIMKTKIHSSKLRVDNSEKITFNSNKVSKKGVISKASRSVKTELDIRGYAVDEGLYELDSFIDNAVMSGIGVITIIHGKGTGVLKNAVRSHLKNHKQIKSYRRGVYGEGEDGVTVAELK
ncbi:MAG: endonuclease MutS2 [Ruminococcus sp.]|nr:endonuclease MutS2 [Ruminococcus sp.]